MKRLWKFIWELSENTGIGLGRFAPFVFGKLINVKNPAFLPKPKMPWLVWSKKYGTFSVRADAPKAIQHFAIGFALLQSLELAFWAWMDGEDVGSIGVEQRMMSEEGEDDEEDREL